MLVLYAMWVIGRKRNKSRNITESNICYSGGNCQGMNQKIVYNQGRLLVAEIYFSLKSLQPTKEIKDSRSHVPEG